MTGLRALRQRLQEVGQGPSFSAGSLQQPAPLPCSLPSPTLVSSSPLAPPPRPCAQGRSSATPSPQSRTCLGAPRVHLRRLPQCMHLRLWFPSKCKTSCVSAGRAPGSRWNPEKSLSLPVSRRAAQPLQHQILGAVDWMLVSPQNSHVEALSSSGMVFGGGASGRQAGHQGGALRGISTPACFSLHPVSRPRERRSRVQARKRALPKSQTGWHLDYGFPASNMVINQCSLLKPARLRHLVRAARADRDGREWHLRGPIHMQGEQGPRIDT